MQRLHHRGIIVLLAVACALSSVACTTIDPYTREEQTSRATQGALIGAGVGIATGLITGDGSAERKERALILGGVGALTGGAIGAYQDRQEAELRRRLEGTGVSVTRMGDNITLNMPGDVTFDVDRAHVAPNFYPVLDSVALVLNEFDQTMVEVAGHTDSTGTWDYNKDLSRRRSEGVAAYLRSREVAGQRMLVVAAGEDYPIADNGTDRGRQLNRRVEITIVPVTT